MRGSRTGGKMDSSFLTSNVLLYLYWFRGPCPFKTQDRYVSDGWLSLVGMDLSHYVQAEKKKGQSLRSSQKNMQGTCIWNPRVVELGCQDVIVASADSEASALREWFGGRWSPTADASPVVGGRTNRLYPSTSLEEFIGRNNERFLIFPDSSWWSLHPESLLALLCDHVSTSKNTGGHPLEQLGALVFLGRLLFLSFCLTLSLYFCYWYVKFRYEKNWVFVRSLVKSLGTPAQHIKLKVCPCLPRLFWGPSGPKFEAQFFEPFLRSLQTSHLFNGMVGTMWNLNLLWWCFSRFGTWKAVGCKSRNQRPAAGGHGSGRSDAWLFWRGQEPAEIW